MLRVEKIRTTDGNGNAVIDIQVSTIAELPALGEQLGYRLKVQAGSIAQIIQADEPTFLTLDEDGIWYPEQADSSKSLNMSASPNLTKESLDKVTTGEKSVLYPEPEQIEPEEAYEESIEEPEKDGEEDAELL